jgi:hypothetical protein
MKTELRPRQQSAKGTRRKRTVPDRIIETLETRPEVGRTPSSWLCSLSTPLDSDIIGVDGMGELLKRRDFLLMARPCRSSVVSKQTQDVPSEVVLRCE